MSPEPNIQHSVCSHCAGKEHLEAWSLILQPLVPTQTVTNLLITNNLTLYQNVNAMRERQGRTHAFRESTMLFGYSTHPCIFRMGHRNLYLVSACFSVIFSTSPNLCDVFMTDLKNKRRIAARVHVVLFCILLAHCALGAVDNLVGDCSFGFEAWVLRFRFWSLGFELCGLRFAD